MKDGRMVFVGVGGDIEGLINPELRAQPGDLILLTLVNGDGMAHDLAIDHLGVKTTLLTLEGDRTEVRFEASSIGSFEYYCTVSGHRQAGMVGKLVIAAP